MIHRKIGHLMAASAFVFAFSLTGVGAMAVFAADSPTPGSDLATDIQAGQAGPQAVANDEGIAEEVDANNFEITVDEETDNVVDTSTSQTP
jgi:hypothetical protein